MRAAGVQFVLSMYSTWIWSVHSSIELDIDLKQSLGLLERRELGDIRCKVQSKGLGPLVYPNWTLILCKGNLLMIRL